VVDEIGGEAGGGFAETEASVLITAVGFGREEIVAEARSTLVINRTRVLSSFP
jgi:hypothetical protein